MVGLDPSSNLPPPLTIRSFCLGLVVTACIAASGRAQLPAPTSAQRATWSATLHRYLTSDLWTGHQGYDAGHILLVPLHAAFAMGDSAWMGDFDAQFARFAGTTVQPRPAAPYRQDLDQYLFLASEYLVVTRSTGHGSHIPTALPRLIGEELQTVWLADTVGLFGRQLAGGLRARLDQKLDHPHVHPAYLTAVDDRDRFTFATAANVATYDRMTGTPVPGWVSEILTYARRAVDQRGSWTADSGWLFQPGIWDEYKDFAFAGWPDTVGADRPRPGRDVAEDVSHSFRWPVFLTALARAAGPDTALREHYLAMRRGLERQFFGHVVVPPGPEFPGYRLMNYMDGANGPYRWSLDPVERRHGVGPYGLSGSVTMGWWAFLGTTRASLLYDHLETAFPLPLSVRDLYERGPADETPAGIIGQSYRNGLRRLIVQLASVIPVYGSSQ